MTDKELEERLKLLTDVFFDQAKKQQEMLSDILDMIKKMFSIMEQLHDFDDIIEKATQKAKEKGFKDIDEAYTYLIKSEKLREEHHAL